MTKKDWEILPAPEPWTCDDGTMYTAAKIMLVILTVMAVVLVLASLSLWFFSAAMMIIGIVVFYISYSHATDGVAEWSMNLPVSRDLYTHLEKTLRTKFGERGYRFSDLPAGSAINDPETGEPMGRKFLIIQVPMESPGQKGPALKDTGLAVSFYFSVVYKPQTAYFSLDLERITASNYRAAMILQRDIVGVLDGLNYKSYNDRRRPVNR